MRLTQGTFSFLPDLTDDEIEMQLDFCLDHRWAVSVEYTDDPHPCNTYWEMWGQPMFDLRDAAGIMGEIGACRDAYPQHYIRVNAFDSTHGVESIALSFIVNRPNREPGFWVQRSGGAGQQRYAVISYAVSASPENERYEFDGSGD